MHTLEVQFNVCSDFVIDFNIKNFSFDSCSSNWVFEQYLDNIVDLCYSK